MANQSVGYIDDNRNLIEKNHPKLSLAIFLAEPLVRKYRECLLRTQNEQNTLIRTPTMIKNYKNYELEASIGHFQINNGNFESFVDKSTFDEMLERAESVHDWFEIYNWQESHDVFFRTKLPDILSMGSSKVDNIVRTTVQYIPSNAEDGRKGQMIVDHCLKSVIDRVDLCDMKNFVSSSDHGGKFLGVRVSLKLERNISGENLDECVTPIHFRIKQRKSFVYKSKNCVNGTWRYDFSRVWSGQNKADAERKQQNQVAPNYEIELEMIGGSEYLSDQRHTNFYTAASMLLKMIDLMDPMRNKVGQLRSVSETLRMKPFTDSVDI